MCTRTSPRWAIRVIALAVLLSGFPPAICTAQEPDQNHEWNNTPAQKMWGLMQVWGSVKTNFAFFDQVPDLDWDAAVRSAIPRVLAAPDKQEYYNRLNELTALLHDGHTLVLSPALMNGENDNPPLEFQVVENVIVLARAGDTEQIRTQGIRPGMELLAVDTIPARQYLEEHALRYYSGSTVQNGEAFGMFLLLNGPKNSTVQLTLKDGADKTHTVTLTRNSQNSDGSVFKFRILDYSPLVASKLLDNRIAYIRLATFGEEQIVEDFNRALDQFDLEGLNGMILDLRYNLGGDDGNAYPILSHLVDHPVAGNRWSTREYRPAFASWGKPEGTYQGETTQIEPSADRQYRGPLVILTGPATMSTSEDFLVPLDYSGRALLIGETTAGTTGNPVNTILPGGAILRVCSKRDVYPDGRQFVGYGIPPDIAAPPSVAGILAHRDEALEKAVAVLGDWDRYKAMTTYTKLQ